MWNIPVAFSALRAEWRRTPARSTVLKRQKAAGAQCSMWNTEQKAHISASSAPVFHMAKLFFKKWLQTPQIVLYLEVTNIKGGGKWAK